MMKITDFKLTNDLVNKLNEYAHQIFLQKPELILDVVSSSGNYCEESYQVHNYCKSCTNCYASNSPIE